jgi:dihydrodipicolinate synthase/N-acetylneuraminate lyase
VEPTIHPMKRYPSCIMATCCVPWDGQYGFLENVFRRQVRRTLQQGTKHLYVFGTAGEGYAVTDRQFDQIVAAFADEMRAGDAEPMVGVISLSLGTVVERIERCRSRGVRRFQISLPSWGALSEPELFDFFRRTCGAFPDCQFVHYNLPRTKRLVQPAEYARLAEEHANLVGTKNCGDSLDFLRGLLAATPQLQHFLSEVGYAYGSLLGYECGLLASYVTSWPKLKRLFEAGRQRDAATLATLIDEVAVLSRELSAAVGPAPHIDGAFDKLFCRLHDPEFPTRLLPPYVTSGDAACDRLAAALRAKLPSWLPA